MPCQKDPNYNPDEVPPKGSDDPENDEPRQEMNMHQESRKRKINEKHALSENLTEWAYYVAFMIRRRARSSRLLADSRLALSSR